MRADWGSLKLHAAQLALQGLDVLLAIQHRAFQLSDAGIAVGVVCAFHNAPVGEVLLGLGKGVAFVVEFLFQDGAPSVGARAAEFGRGGHGRLHIGNGHATRGGCAAGAGSIVAARGNGCAAMRCFNRRFIAMFHAGVATDFVAQIGFAAAFFGVGCVAAFAAAVNFGNRALR